MDVNGVELSKQRVYTMGPGQDKFYVTPWVAILRPGTDPIKKISA